VSRADHHRHGPIVTPVIAAMTGELLAAAIATSTDPGWQHCRS